MSSDFESARPPDWDGLRELVIAVLERLDRDGPQALEDACREHPELATKLRERVVSLQSLGLVGGAGPPERMGEFRLVERIGSGGMGIVYRAVQESLGREVALKLIRPEILHQPQARERFLRETEVIARLQHPGIVPIYTVGGAGDAPYYAMEWVRGCTLAEALAGLAQRPPHELRGEDLERAVLARASGEHEPSQGSYLYSGSWEEVCLRICHQIADALEHAHRRGVLHRDVKPGNVMLTPGGRVMLVDFGLSQSEGQETVTRSGERPGSLPYMPPELLRHGPRNLDSRSDVYSLGVTLYQSLTLQMPFSASSEPAAMQRILEGRPTPLRQHSPGISWEAETVCLAAMDRDPERRYQTAAAFARDLTNALERRPVEARRASLRLRTWRWIQRRPGEAAAILLATLLAVVVPSLVAWFQAEKRRKVDAALQVAQSEKARAEQQQARAEANFERALKTVDTLLLRVSERRLDHMPGVVELRGQLAAEAEAVYRELERERPNDPELLRLAADCKYLRVWSLVTQGHEDEGIQLLQEAVESLEPWIAGGSFELRSSHAKYAEALSRVTSQPLMQAEVLATMRALLAERPDDVGLHVHFLNGLNGSCMRRRRIGEREEGRAELEEATRSARELCERSDDHESRLVLAGLVMLHGYWEWLEQRFESAVKPFEEALELYRSVLEEDGTREDARHGAVESGVSMAGVLGALRRGSDALFVLQDVRAEMEWLRQQYPGEIRYEHQEVQFLHNRGVGLVLEGRHEEARDEFRRAVAILEERVRRQDDPREAPYTLGMVLVSLAKQEARLDGPEPALEVCARARTLLEAASASVPDDPDVSSWLVVECLARAGYLLQLNRPAEAAEALAPDLARIGQRLDLLPQVLDSLRSCLSRAQELDDPELVSRCEVAALQALDSIRERDELAQHPAVKALSGALELE